MFDYERNPRVEISKVLERSPGSALNQKLTWDLFPFRLRNRLQPESSLNQYMPLLFGLWGLIFVVAVISTIAMFVS